ncbi:hypothetical protein CCAX7_007870 [Capsulimonas corticalis]|uniref:Uncharacterized protein n=1 Tax=Capsulimonas corticalis TaxID=2219043 RepID=A0A402D1X8_9BACT|nr:hypothetical protein [Capsulimonas corticalis]BDI28736.1 hypothetical protein CCAX7_007870 [Capsulimonas corticalis]
MSHRNPVALRIADSFFRNRWLFLVSVVIVSGVTVAALTTKSNTYTASALTQVSVDHVAVALGERRSSWTSLSQQNVNHFQDLINDDLPGGFLDTALKEANLAVPINMDPKANDRRLAMLRKNLNATTRSESVFAIGLTWDNPTEDEKILAALQNRYAEEVGLDQSAQGIAAGRFLDTQIQIYQTQMQRAEEALIKYRSGNTDNLPDMQSSQLSQLASLTAQRDNLMIAQQDSALRTAALEARLKQVKATTVIEQNRAESPILQQLNAAKVQRDGLLAKYYPAHPAVEQINAVIASLQKQWNDKVRKNSQETHGIMSEKTQDNPEYLNLNQQLTEARITDQTQRSQMANLDKAIAKYNAAARTVPEKQRELNNFTRDYRILKDQYERLRTKREQVRIDSDLNQVSARSTITPLGYIIAKPTMNKTKQMTMMLGGVVLGLVIGALLLILSEWADRSLRYAEDAERLLGVPVLAVLPDSSELNMPTAAGGAAGRKIAGAASGAKGVLSAPGGAPSPAMTSRADG